MPDPATIAAVSQMALGAYQSISGKIASNKLLPQLKAYKTPEEAKKILQMTQAGAQGGYDVSTLNYLTSNINRAGAGALGSAARLGADPNQLSAILDQQIAGLMKVGSENTRMNMERMSQFFSAMDMMAKNKEAEDLSRNNLIKDRLQAAGVNQQAGLQNVGSAANAFIAMYAADETGDLFGNDKVKAEKSRVPKMKRVTSVSR